MTVQCVMNVIAQQQLASHIVAWAAIPASFTVYSPIAHTNENGLDLHGRLTAFASEVRSQENALLRPLGVEQGALDQFMARDGQFRLLFLQLPLPWIASDRPRAFHVLKDLETLSTSLRDLEKKVGSWNTTGEAGQEDETALSIGRETQFLRRLIASRASLAEEILPLMQTEPEEAISIFYNESIRCLRQFDSVTASLDLYHSRRPSWRP